MRTLSEIILTVGNCHTKIHKINNVLKNAKTPIKCLDFHFSALSPSMVKITFKTLFDTQSYITCGKCNITKPYYDFSGKAGKTCKSCIAETSKKHYHSNKNIIPRRGFKKHTITEKRQIALHRLEIANRHSTLLKHNKSIFGLKIKSPELIKNNVKDFETYCSNKDWIVDDYKYLDFYILSRIDMEQLDIDYWKKQEFERNSLESFEYGDHLRDSEYIDYIRPDEEYGILDDGSINFYPHL